MSLFVYSVNEFLVAYSLCEQWNTCDPSRYMKFLACPCLSCGSVQKAKLARQLFFHLRVKAKDKKAFGRNDIGAQTTVNYQIGIISRKQRHVKCSNALGKTN